MMAYQTKAVELHSTVKMRIVLEDGRVGITESTVGRFIFNENIPQDLGFVNREEDPFGLEIDYLVDKKALGKIIDKCFRRHGNTITAEVLDHIKSLGFKYSTIGGITVAVADMKIPATKQALIKDAEVQVEKYEKYSEEV